MAVTGTAALLLTVIDDCVKGLEGLEAQITSLQAGKKLSRAFLIGQSHIFKQERDSLKKWRDDFASNNDSDAQRPDYAATIRDAHDFGDLINQNIELASTFLNECGAQDLNPAERDVLPSKIEEKADDIDKYINEIDQLLNALRRHVLRDEIARVGGTIGALTDDFVQKIRQIPPEIRNNSFRSGRRKLKLQFGNLPWFWASIRRPVSLTHVAQPPDRVPIGFQGDGAVITPEYLDRAREVLHSFKEAWITVVSETDPDFELDDFPLTCLTKLPRVVIVLHVTQKRHLLNDFVEHEKTDDDMDNYPDATVGVLESDGELIKVQYYRANRRQWDHGTTLDLHPYEPLPLVTQKKYSDERGSHVEKVTDAWFPNDHYVRKRVWKDQAYHAQNRQFDNEVKCLQLLGKEDHGHHIVKIVKSYTRGQEIGMLIHPVADGNLSQLLERCCSHRGARNQYQQSLIRAFGCLAYSLCYLHNVKMFRHRDVKPHNVLYLKEPDGTAEFIWADFGLTYDFSQEMQTNGLGSGTRDKFFKATAEYEAPEISYNRMNVHGRSADIFSLGCIFLEIISVLTMPSKVISGGPEIRKFWPYKQNIKNLESWATKRIDTLNRSDARDKFLRDVLGLAKEMIVEDPKKRPKIGTVTKRLGDYRHGSDQKVRTFCGRCAQKYQRDRRGEPIHPNIFEWKRFDWLHPFTKFGIRS